MCNDYEQQIAWDFYAKAMAAAGMQPDPRNGEADLPRADDVRIGDLAPIARLGPEGVGLSSMRFGFPAAVGADGKPRGGPVFNFRSEGRSFAESRRCLIPASAFFEFTGTKYPKAKHRFTLEGAPFLCIAGLWREGQGNQPPSFTMLTTQPGPDVAPIHNRQICVLPPGDWKAWLELSRTEAELLRPLPAGSLSVALVRAGKD